MSVVLLVGANSSSRLFEILDILHFEEKGSRYRSDQQKIGIQSDSN